MRQKRFVLLLAIVFVSAGCAEKPLPPPLPQGTLTLSGVLLPAELDLVRRGSHVLRQGGIETYYVESAAVNLRAVEGEQVTLRGTLEQNVEPHMLPVLVVQSIVDVEHAMKEWELKGLGIRLVAPRDWRRSTEGPNVFFFLDETVTPVVAISQVERPEDDDELPEGTSIVVGGKPGILQFSQSTGAQLVAVTEEDRILVFRFTPREYGNQAELKAKWIDLLHSIRFDVVSVASSSQRQQTSTGSGIPCGGTAGILCPEGKYCAIMDFKENIGRCQRMVHESIQQ